MGQEAQRIMAASMSKIASSRNRRSGVDLHRNLLITTVLHKARSQFLADNFQTKTEEVEHLDSMESCQHRADELSRQTRESQDDYDSEDMEHESDDDLSHYPVSQVPLDSPYHQEYSQEELKDIELELDSPVVSDDITTTDILSTPDEILSECDQSLTCHETLGAVDDEPVLYTLLPAKNRDLEDYRSTTDYSSELDSLESRYDCSETMRVCTKRHYDDSDDDDVFYECKKLKGDYVNEDFQETVEEDSYQVSHLVSIFNNGFTTLTGKDLACSITLKEEFTSSLSRPILAMAMV